MARLKRSKKTKAAKKTIKLSSGWRLLKSSLADYRLNLKPIGAVVLVAVIANWFIRLSSTAETAAIYQGLWFAFVSCSLIWTIRHTQDKQSPKLSQVYWTGSAATLKLLVVLAVVALSTLPFTIGAFIFSAISWLEVTGSYGGELIAAILWLIGGLLSLLLLARLLPAVIIVTLPDIGPGKAIGLSWRSVKGASWQLSSRLLWFLVYALLIVALISLAFNLFNFNPTLTTATLESAVFILVLPVLYLGLFKLYKELTG